MYDHCRLTSFDEYGLRAGFPPAYDKEHLCETSFSSYLLCIDLSWLMTMFWELWLMKQVKRRKNPSARKRYLQKSRESQRRMK